MPQKSKDESLYQDQKDFLNRNKKYTNFQVDNIDDISVNETDKSILDR